MLFSPRCAGLSSLHLAGNGLTDETGRVLLDSPYLANLTCLNLLGNTFSPEMQEALRARFGGVVWV